MKIRVKYFGRLAVELGKYSELIDLEENCTVEQFLNILREKHPVLKNEEIEVSVNGHYAPPEMVINSHEISVYPPISGD
ncbi:MAG: MoaD/ThiS family protein [Euryarchaeota archaeon]|nr:MoaD/ThiS family protein [Euryarchaeota archaeon]